MLKDPIARRYFVMNFFDGIMTAFGIVVGGAVSIGNSATIIKAGLGASLAIMISGGFGAYMVEKTERRLELKKMERQLLRTLKGTQLEKEAHNAAVALAFVDAASPFFGAVIPIIPFFFNLFGLISYSAAIFTSISLSFALLIFLGWYLGKLLKENPVKNALIFALGGVVVGVVSSILERFLH
ncbi:MAG: hypothetical protein GOU98_04335 [Candidatus Altiarchaeota archaeon]|nr:hypothetical protein [Candidatus Altiarchaeota archaeon]